MNKTLTNRLNNQNGMLRRKQLPIYVQSTIVQTVNGITAMINRNEKAPQGKAKIELGTLRKILTNYLRNGESINDRLMAGYVLQHWDQIQGDLQSSLQDQQSAGL